MPTMTIDDDDRGPFGKGRTGRAGEFSVYQFFPDDTWERVCQFVDARTACECAFALTRSVGAGIGTTQRVIITDGGDCTCFEWRHGEGVTWPRPGGEKPN